MSDAIAERIVGIMTPVLAAILIGFLYARHRPLDLTVVTRLTVDLFAPALIFAALASRDFSIYDNRWLLAASALIVLGSGLLAWPIARVFGFPVRAFVPPMMFNNCGNMGLPLAVLTFGPAGLAPAVAMFAVSNALQFTLGIRIVQRGASLRGLLFTPMNIATAAGFLVAATDLPRPELLIGSFRLIGEATIPLMLFALGVRMVSVTGASWRISVVGAVAAPLTGLAVAALIDPFLPLDNAQRGLLYIFASLPPAVLNFLLAERYGQSPEDVASIVLIGNVAAVFFVPIGLVFALG